MRFTPFIHASPLLMVSLKLGKREDQAYNGKMSKGTQQAIGVCIHLQAIEGK